MKYRTQSRRGLDLPFLEIGEGHPVGYNPGKKECSEEGLHHESEVEWARRITNQGFIISYKERVRSAPAGNNT